MNVGEIQITAQPNGHVLIRADDRGLSTLVQLVEGARTAGWANIADEVTGQEKVRIERVEPGVISP